METNLTNNVFIYKYNVKKINKISQVFVENSR